MTAKDNEVFLPFAKPFIAGKELYYIAQAVQSGHLSGDGAFSASCHLWFKEHLGCQSALLTQSCTAALEMAALLCDIREGDEVILPSFTFVSTANAFALRGAVPVFVDIRDDTLNIDENLLEEAVSKRTKVVVPVHYAGVPCAMNEIMHIASRRDLLVVEDAAHSLLATDPQGRALGTIGHLGCLSFHETKNVISGEGGAILVNSNRFTDRAEIVREKGTNRTAFFRGEASKYTWLELGSSYLPSELTAAFLFAQLEHANLITERRRSLCAQYYAELKPLETCGVIRLPKEGDVRSGPGHIFYLLAENEGIRSQLQEHLRRNLIHAVSHYVPLHSSPAGRRLGKTIGTLPVTDRVAASLLRLPLYFEMREQDVSRVTSQIRAYFSGR